jgi:FolB domain-containing protein
MTHTVSTALTLNGLRLSVFLGVYPAEIQKKQTITLDAQIQFSSPPQACTTDKLADTYCYDSIISHLKEKLASRRFQMIEHFSREVHGLLLGLLPPDVKLAVRVTKLPAIADLTGGVTFRYGDELPAW